MIPDEKKMDSKKEPGFEPITDDPENHSHLFGTMLDNLL